MNELINLVSQKTGLPPDKAKVAVDTVLNFLKSKLPPNLAGQLDKIAAGGDASNNPLGDLGGLFGKQK